jgi:hypothetical protein
MYRRQVRLDQARMHRETLRTELPDPAPSAPEIPIEVAMALGLAFLLGAGWLAWQAGKAALTGGRAFVDALAARRRGVLAAAPRSSLA